MYNTNKSKCLFVYINVEKQIITKGENKILMKKFWTIVTSLVLVVCSVFSLAACGKKDEADKVTKVKLNNVQAFYQTTDSPAFDEMTLTITTSKSGELTLTKAQFDLAKVSEAAADTEFVLFTSGLHAETPGALTEGTYKFSVYVVSYGQTFTDFLTVTVTDNLSEGYDLVAYLEPEFVSDYNARKVTSETDSSKFYQVADYEVGDDNPFTFKPRMSVVDKLTDEIVVPDYFNLSVTVKENGTAVGSEVYTYSNFGFQFTNAAVGHIYTISAVPADFTHDEDGVAVTPATLTVTVCDGYNISQENVKDLGRMSLVSSTFVRSAYSGSDNPTGWRYVGSDSEDIYYDPTTHTTRLDGNSFDYWAAYYTRLGVTDAAPVNGIFIHGNVSVKPSDLPDEFFISADEAADASVGSNYEDYKHLIGTPRDFAFLYAHYMEGEAFTFNGNSFKLDFSAIPFGLTNKDTGITGTGFYYSKNQSKYAAGHTSIFNFVGRGDNSVSIQATFKNVELVGNFNPENSAISGEEADMKASGSLIGLKSIAATVSTSNCLVRSCLVGLYAEYNHAYNGMALVHCKVYDCYNSGLFTWHGENNTLTHSELKRFGGPAIFVVCGTNDDQSPEALADFTIDDESTVESFVVGDEVWFILNGATSAAGMFTATGGLNDALMKSYNVSFVIGGKINMMGLFMESKGLLSSDNLLYGNMSFGGADELGMDLLQSVEDAYYIGLYNVYIDAEQPDAAAQALSHVDSMTYKLFAQYHSGIIITNEGTVALVGQYTEGDQAGAFFVVVLGQYDANSKTINSSDTTIHGDTLYTFLPTNPSGGGILVLALQIEHLA